MRGREAVAKPAWSRYSYENMRGRRVNGWYVITHIRNGKWKACRVRKGRMVMTTLWLNWFGKPVVRG